MRKTILLLIGMFVLAGCVQQPTNGLIGTPKTNGSLPQIDSGLKPIDAVELYLTYMGYGKYVTAYELVSDKQKRDQTIQDMKKVESEGKTELHKVIGTQQKGNVALVTAATKVTDNKSKKQHYQVQEYVLKKVDNNWKITQKSDLNQGQLKDLNGLVTKQAEDISKSPDTQQLLTWMEQQNNEFAGGTKSELFAQAGDLKSQLNSLVQNNRGVVQDSITGVVNALKDTIISIKDQK